MGSEAYLGAGVLSAFVCPLIAIAHIAMITRVVVIDLIYEITYGYNPNITTITIAQILGR